MSYGFYKVVHIVGILMLFCGLAAFFGQARAGKVSKVTRITLSLLHGVGLALILVSGFGLLARLGVHSMPTWVYFKLAIWILFGASLALAKRKAHWGMSLLGIWIALGGLAAYIAIHKPF